MLKGDETYTEDNIEIKEILRSKYDSVFGEPKIRLKTDIPN